MFPQPTFGPVTTPGQWRRTGNSNFGPRSVDIGAPVVVMSGPSNPFDIAGAVQAGATATLNSYIDYAGKELQTYGPEAIVALLLIVIMIITAYLFLKG